MTVPLSSLSITVCKPCISTNTSTNVYFLSVYYVTSEVTVQSIHSVYVSQKNKFFYIRCWMSVFCSSFFVDCIGLYPAWIVYYLAFANGPAVARADSGWEDRVEKLHCGGGRKGQLDRISLHSLDCQLGAHYLIFSISIYLQQSSAIAFHIYGFNGYRYCI